MLDIQWSPHSHTSGQGEILAVATSTGRVEFYKFTVDGLGQADLVLDGSLVVAEEALLVLSLAWHPTLSNVVGVTLSDGSVRLCRLDEGKDAGGLLVEATQTIVQKHELEAWTLAFPPPREHRGGRIDVFSGGDDAVLKFSSVNSSELNEDIDPREVNLEVSWQDRKIHQAGVTAILPLTSDLVVTGSYDDHIRLLSCPKVGRRKVLAEANLGGGVWRLKDITAPGPDALDKDENVGISVDAGGSRRYVSVFHTLSLAGRTPQLPLATNRFAPFDTTPSISSPSISRSHSVLSQHSSTAQPRYHHNPIPQFPNPPILMINSPLLNDAS